MDLGDLAIWKFFVSKLSWIVALIAIWNWPWHF